MPLRELLADENIDSRMVAELRTQGFRVLSIAEEHRGATDQEVIKLATTKGLIILTRDSDFGEWVFAHGAQVAGVIYLRYTLSDHVTIMRTLIRILRERSSDLQKAFTVLAPQKIRIRQLPA
ncbi:MAG: DUF5615 family PIN-like protein [Campylobacterales bacterium]